MLGSILKYHYPGLVKTSDDPNAEPVLVSCWDEYKLKKDVTYGDAQGLVRADFWVRSSCLFLLMSISCRFLLMCIFLVGTFSLGRRG